MTQSQTPLSLTQRLMRAMALCVSLSLAITLILQAQSNVSGVVAQETHQAQQATPAPKNNPATSPTHADPRAAALFDQAPRFFAQAYAIELIPARPAKSTPDQQLKLRVHKTNPKQVRYLKVDVMKALTQLKDQSSVSGLTATELTALKRLDTELKENAREINSRFAHTSKSMAAPPSRDTHPVLVDPQTLSALMRLMELKR